MKALNLPLYNSHILSLVQAESVCGPREVCPKRASDRTDQGWTREQRATNHPSLHGVVVVLSSRAPHRHPPVGPNANNFSVSPLLAQIFLKCTLLVHT